MHSEPCFHFMKAGWARPPMKPWQVSRECEGGWWEKGNHRAFSLPFLPSFLPLVRGKLVMKWGFLTTVIANTFSVAKSVVYSSRRLIDLLINTNVFSWQFFFHVNFLFLWQACRESPINSICAIILFKLLMSHHVEKVVLWGQGMLDSGFWRWWVSI